MDEQSRPAPEPNLPRQHFHLTLALIFIPCGAVIGGWTLAILDVLKGYSNRAQLTWMRLLVALVLADALVLGSIVWMSAHLDEFQPKTADAKRSMIGVLFDSGDALKIREVQPGMPGARAGLQAGDVIEKIDGTAVATAKALTDALQTRKAGTPRALSVRRGDASIEVAVSPEIPPEPGARGLFEVDPAVDFRFMDEVVVAQLPALAVVFALVGWGRLKNPRAVPVWSGFLLALVGAMTGSVGFLALARARAGGLSLGLFLVSLQIQVTLMLALTAVARKWLTRDVPPELPSMLPWRAGLQGFFYLVTGMPRIGVLLLVAAHVLFPDAPLGDPMVQQLAEARFGVLGGAMLFVGVALVGPLAEEFLFRGYLLPRLVVQWGQMPALFCSSLIFALLHLRDGPFVPVIFFYGWVFGWARLRSGSLIPSAALHMAVNSVAAAAILLQK